MAGRRMQCSCTPKCVGVGGGGDGGFRGLES